MDFKKYDVVYLLVVLVAVAFAVRLVFPNTQLIRLNTSMTGSPATQEAVTVVVDFGDTQKTYADISASNAYLALVEAAKRDNLDVKTKEYDFGVLVEQVGSYANRPELAWIYFVNGAAGDVAADKKQVNPSDTVVWKYIKPN